MRLGYTAAGRHIHIIPVNSDHTLCGWEVPITARIEQEATQPTCKRCIQSREDMLVVSLDPTKIDRSHYRQPLGRLDTAHNGGRFNRENMLRDLPS